MAHIKQPTIEPKIHRRILRFLNDARTPEELMAPPPTAIRLIDEKVMFGHDEATHTDEAAAKQVKPELLLDLDVAKCVFKERERISPIYGFRHIEQVLAGTRRSISGIASTSTGRIERTSLGRLPGSNATVGAFGSSR